ncbi:tyrosine-type recombinase/integrase [Bacteroides heparinolyticus]|uniref:tyrosine-type recombinase/integrase n=1 Tax=Prevotella heparinolytica TaxID=28113 RepID=UPI00359F3416
MTLTPYKKKDGKTYYMLKAYNGIDPKTGKPNYICRRGFKTSKDAHLAYSKIIAQKSIKTNEKLTYQDVYEMWMDEHKTQVKESTLKTDITKFERHILPTIGHYLIDKITHKDMQAAVNKWAESVERVGKIKTAAGAVFRYAIEHEYLDKNPLSLVKVPKKHKEKPFENYLDRDELQVFLDAVDKYLPEMWSTFLHLIAMTGIRRGEALALEWRDIDFERGTLDVNKTLSKAFKKAVISSTKTKASNRTITLGQTILDRLKAYKSVCTSDTLVFPNTCGKHITMSQPQKKTALVCKKAGIKSVTPHGLRHTHCCLLFEAGASIAQVQQRLGHSDSKITLEIYNHVTRGKVRETAEIFENYIFLQTMVNSVVNNKITNV